MAITDQINGLGGSPSATDAIVGGGQGLAYKAPVRAATTTNITLSGEQTIDGVAVVDGDRVLVKNQTDASENGIYIASTGAWTRATDFDSNRDVTKGTRVSVTDGSANITTSWQVAASNPIAVGTDNITFSLVGSSSIGDMLAATYDPQGIGDDAFDRANHTGTQLAATISDFSTAADARISAAIGVSVQAYDADLAVWAGVTSSANGRSLVSAADYAAMRGLLDLEAGTDFLSPAAIAAAYQPLDSDLTAIAALTTTAGGRGLLTLSDPNADRIVFWDDSAGAFTHLTPGTGLAISGTSLDLDADLQTIAGLTATTDNFIVSVASAWASRTPAQVRTTLAVVGAAEDFIPAEDFVPPITNGAQAGIRILGSNGQALFYYAFDTGTQEILWAKWLPKKRYDGGTITFAPIWTAESGSGTVEFELSGVAVSNDDALDAAPGTAQASADTLLTAGDNHTGPTSSAITIAGTFADGDFVWLKLVRDVANDTLGVDAQFLGLKIFYTTDQGNDA